MNGHNNNQINIISDEELEYRVGRAVELFKSGFNCSQSIVTAFADIYGFSEDQALKMAASFGAGIGRMRLTCGAACGMFLLAGLDCGATEGSDRQGKSKNYVVVQELAQKFERETGSLTCSKLLGLNKPEGSAEAEKRTPEYYKKRPCSKMVEVAARIFGSYLKEKINAQ